LHNAQGWTLPRVTKIIISREVAKFTNVLNTISVLVILLNAFMIGYETDATMRVALGKKLHQEGNGPWTDGLSNRLKVLFEVSGFLTYGWLCVEVVIAAKGQKWEYVVGPDWRWNMFDVSVLLITTTELGMTYGFSQKPVVNMSLFRVLRLARIARCVRMFRVLKFLRRVRSMLIAMAGSVVPLAWAMLLMLMIMFSISIVILQGLANHLDDTMDVARNNTTDNSIRRLQWASEETGLDDGPFYWHVSFTPMQQMQTLYGSLFRSIMTCFRAVIGEIDYFTAVYVLWEVDWSYAAIFVLFHGLMIFGVLNVLTGIFCDAAMQAAQQDRDNMIQERMEGKEQLVKALTRLFGDVDGDHSGFVSTDEFDSMMSNPTVLETLDQMGISVSEASGLFHLLDSGGDNKVDVHEFVSGCVRLKGDAKAVDMVTLIYENKKVLSKIRSLEQLIHSLAFGEPVPE
jgi:hypothetical protein